MFDTVFESMLAFVAVFDPVVIVVFDFVAVSTFDSDFESDEFCIG